MKKILSIILILALLLGGCAEPPPPAPIYDEAPALTEKGITIAGSALSGVYSDGVTEYLCLQEFADALGGSVEIAEQDESFIARLTLGENIHTFAEGKRYDGEKWYQPKADLMPLLQGYHPFEDTEKKHTYYTAYPLAQEVEEGKEVPILMYHAVSDNCWGIPQLFVSPKNLEEQLQYLQENGYTTVTFEDFGRLGSIEKPVMLTFDDGYSDNFAELFPLLQKYQAKATIFLIYDKLDQLPYYLTREQVKEMDASGLVSFQSHTMSHLNLDTLDEEQLQYELAQSKLELTRLLGKEMFVVAYPSGKWNEQSLQVTQAQYQFGLLSRGGTYETGDHPAKVSRYYVRRSTTLNEFIDMID
ncbi:MAG: polysaccharide deacetylase family protein [Clostridia bacterium]|nr:polysaccharide deacetylase family protein [Clostridia bacterium]